MTLRRIITRISDVLGLSGSLASRETKISLVICASMVISVIHQPGQPLINAIFLPQIGSILLLFIPILYLQRSMIDLRDRWVWIPLAVIVLTAALRPLYVIVTGDTVWGMKLEVTQALYLACMFGLYLTSRKLGLQIFRTMPLFVVIVSLGMVVYGFVNPGLRTGGLISFTNYDMTTIFLIFGLLVSPVQHRWWLSAFVIAGLFFTGAETALFAVGAMLLVVLVRRDWGTRLLAPTVALGAVLLVCTPLGITDKLWTPAYDKVMTLASVPTANAADRDILLNQATNLRWLGYWKLSPISPLGYGYNINYFYEPQDGGDGKMTAVFAREGVTGGIPHNVVLVIIEQLGLVALVAWLTATGRLLWKSGWTYAWVGYIVLGIWDHELWTVFAPYMFVLAGVSSANPITRDYIFRTV